MIMPTITVDDELKQELKKIGRKGESYNDIVDRLLTYYCTKKLDAELNDILENEEFTPLDLEAI
ncbi:MAG: antitoxin VapB family protein [Methanomicrobium sp.]|nr:antitoxin VapB family protein [Methanomicrobium sp.]MDD4126329.1 antitoxin VapB family protein [Methanomicrobium sp.]